MRRGDIRLLLLLRNLTGENVGVWLYIFTSISSVYSLQHEGKVCLRGEGGKVHHHHRPGLLPVRGQLSLRLHHGQSVPHPGEGHHQEQLLRHLQLHLPSGHGYLQQGPSLGQLPHPGHRQVLQAHPRDGAGGAGGQEALPPAEVPLHPDDRGGGRHVHVQGQQEVRQLGRRAGGRRGAAAAGQPHLRRVDRGRAGRV